MDRRDFSLVYESHYLPEAGILAEPRQVCEIGVQGRGGTPPKLKPPMLPVEMPRKFEVAIEDSRGMSSVIKIETCYGHNETYLREMAMEEREGLEWETPPYIHWKIGEMEMRLGSSESERTKTSMGERLSSDQNIGSSIHYLSTLRISTKKYKQTVPMPKKYWNRSKGNLQRERDQSGSPGYGED
jgi:hypothetical protein